MGNFFAIPNLYNSNPVFFSSTSSPQQPLQSPPESPVASPTSPASSELLNTSPPSHPSPLQSSPPPTKSIPNVRVVTNLSLNVPCTEYAILDFLPDSNSPENMTYQHLLSDDSTKNSIALCGMGGVGKTTTLCALGRKQEIRYIFKDGVFFFRLGHDITMPSFIRQLQRLVESVLPEFLEDFKERAASKDSYNSMIIELTNLLTQKRFLLLFDDVCEADASVYRLVCAMCASVQRSERKFLKLLSSTRNRNVANAIAPKSCIPINPGDSNDSKCLDIFCTKAGISKLDIPSLSAENENALGHIMRTCGGLPLALSLAGSAVKQLMDPSLNHCDQNAISEFWGRLEPNIGHLARGEIENRHKGLACVLLNSSQFLEKWESEKETEKLGDEVRAREMFKSFCIMQKQICLPMSAIEELWNVREVKTGKRMLSRNSLFSEVREGNEIATESDEIVGVGVHDLVREMGMEMAKSRGGATKWHARVLEGYRGSLNISGGTEDDGEGEGMEW